MKRFVYLLTCLALLLQAGTSLTASAKMEESIPVAQSPSAARGQGGDGTWYVVNLEDTPLTRGINHAHGKLKDPPEKGPTAKNDKELKQGGKALGHVSRNITTLEYSNPRQKDPKGEKETWDSVKINMKQPKPEGWKEDAALQPAGFDDTRSRGNAAFSGYNDDADCVDQVTGEHKGGIGKESECFAGVMEDHVLVRNLVAVTIDGQPYCQHPDDASFLLPLDECDDRGWTSLLELIDEDGDEILDVDGDGNELDNDNDGINDDGDCTVNDPTSTDQTCFPLIDEDLGAQLDNDRDGSASEDPAGRINDPMLDEPGELCRAYYAGLSISWDESYYNANTGECNVDAAITKQINKESNRKFGKNVFQEGGLDNPKNKWDANFTQDTRSFVFSYPENLNPPLITLKVTEAEESNSCHLNLKDLPQETTVTNCNTPSGKPNANFSVACTGRDCTFTASVEDVDSYSWDLGKLEPGNERNGHSKDKIQAHVRGKEARTVTVAETMLLQCQPGYVYEEDPNSPVTARKVRCKKPMPLSGSDLRELQAVADLLPASTVPVETALDDDSPEINRYAMMGFTFAPPVLGWGWRIEEEVCVFGFCFEIFYARVGYEFNVGMGLRLPIQVNITPVDPMSWPDDVWAEQNLYFDTSITPLDFTAEQFKQVCEQNQLADGLLVANCDRFSFPNFLNPQDGDEFAAYYKIFAGIIVRVLSIPIITWGVDSSMDLGQLCTMNNALDAVGIEPGEEFDKIEVLLNLAKMVADYSTGEDLDFYNFLKDQGIVCGSFTTPYGFEDGELRTFPFLPEAGYEIPADCINAVTEGKVITIKGKPRPICTNLILGYPGANLGLGLKFKVEAGSDTIGADWSAEGDARPNPGYGNSPINVRWYWPQNHVSDRSEIQTIKVLYDNYDLTRSLDHDVGSLVLDDFTYYLDFWLVVGANLEFGGILSPIPDIAEFELFRVSFGDVFGIDGIPLPQHPGMDPIKLTSNVNNHGLDLLASPDEVSVPNGDVFEGVFTVQTTNLGSLDGSFDNFRYELTNIPEQSPPYKFITDPNNDHDCKVDGAHMGGPGKESECYAADGTPLPGVELLVDEDLLPDGTDNDNDGLDGEDPANESWTARLSPVDTKVTGLAPYASDSTVTVTVLPFLSGMTRPGMYPVKIMADSLEARNRPLMGLFPGMPTNLYGYDPDKHVFGRLDAFDLAFVKIEEFSNPQALVQPESASVRPGSSQEYAGQFTNGGNTEDGILVATQRPDSNQAGCTLTTLGHQPGCPYRAMITGLPDGWVIDNFSGGYGPLAPMAYQKRTFTIQVPAEWAGMQDTPYELAITATSTREPGVSNKVTVLHTVEATLESRTRYIIAEIDELIAEVEKANAQGIKTCGIYPISIHPVKLQSQRALDLILAGRSSQALNALSANLKIMQGAYMHGLSGCKSIPNTPWRADWMQRGQAIIDDLTLTTHP